MKPAGSITTVVRYLALVGLGAVMLLPLAIMITTSLKTFPEVMADPPRFLPQSFNFRNYIDAFTTFPFGTYLLNTLILTAARVAGTVISCAVVAWGFARFPSRWNLPLFLLCLSSMMLPAQVTAIPVFSMFLSVGLYDTFWPMILPAWLGTNAFFIFLLKQFFETIPQDMLNAARIDGCGEIRAFLTIGIPLSKPILWVVGVFAFIHSWNDYFGPLIYLIDEAKYPLSLGLTHFMAASAHSIHGTQWHLMMAVSTFTMLPVAFFFFLAQRSFIENAMGGGMKQ